ncbi:hypothetical protein NC653_038508 [Populus alba x Populus x berolinensis]|uniref:Uncharacterized protein n=1 Tax=Populus alba x Populus x berolinensis TaxID=444605 RepID=A0AAD6LH17_9ROSI|nr:hypothetical protein NC653_038508 [Populus alba x Populus x berolinensis]
MVGAQRQDLNFKSNISLKLSLRLAVGLSIHDGDEKYAFLQPSAGKVHQRDDAHGMQNDLLTSILHNCITVKGHGFFFVSVLARSKLISLAINYTGRRRLPVVQVTWCFLTRNLSQVDNRMWILGFYTIQSNNFGK